MIRTSVNIDRRGVRSDKVDYALTGTAKAVSLKIAEKLEKEAKRIYLEKRKKPYKNLIINSFKVEDNSSTEATSYVTLTQGAPHAKYLENDRKMPDGQMWSTKNPKAPYKFMQEGADITRSKVKEIVLKTLGESIRTIAR